MGHIHLVFQAEGVEVVCCAVGANLEPFAQMDRNIVQQALDVVYDSTKHPVLIHCDKGNHRTGCLVGCIR